VKKKHAPSEVARLTMCGYEMTPAEYSRLKRMRVELRHVSCKKCLDLLK
jgi:hypothetical protein